MADYPITCVRVGWISENGDPILQALPCTLVRRQASAALPREHLIISGLQHTPDLAPHAAALAALPEYLDFTPTDGAPQAFQVLTMFSDLTTGHLVVEVYAYA